MQAFRGPLPPPEMLARYEEICPGFAERTLAMAERNAAARQINETAVITSNIKHEGQGQWMAFILALAFLCVGAFALWLHEVGVGVGIWTVDIVAIIGMFIYRQRRIERRAEQGLPPQNLAP